MATAPTPQASSREQSLLAGVSQRVTTKLTSLVELRRRRWHGHNEGSRELHRRLRVGQWEDPPASNQAPSQAAVLFDIAYTTSMMHHADMLTAADSSLTGYATVAYFFTVVQLILHWWSVSLFLCKLDPGDLFNEFVLVLYMVLVVGQALLVGPCAACVLSENMKNKCAFVQGDSFQNLRCTAGWSWDMDSAPGDARWPYLPSQCRLYLLLSLGARALHLLNLLRAVRDVSPRAKRDLALAFAEGLLVLPLWAAAALAKFDADEVYVVRALFGLAVAIEFIFMLAEPAHSLYEWLARRQYLSTHLERVPMDIPYARATRARKRAPRAREPCTLTRAAAPALLPPQQVRGTAVAPAAHDRARGPAELCADALQPELPFHAPLTGDGVHAHHVHDRVRHQGLLL